MFNILISTMREKADLSFCIWHLSLSSVMSSSIHVVAIVKLILSYGDLYTFIYVWISCFLPPVISWRASRFVPYPWHEEWSCFKYGTAGVLPPVDFISVPGTPRDGMTAFCGRYNFRFNFLSNLQIISWCLS